MRIEVSSPIRQSPRGRSAAASNGLVRRRNVVVGVLTFTRATSLQRSGATICATPLTVHMVYFNLITTLGSMDDEGDSAVATALGDAATDLSKLVSGDEVQNLTPAAIIKGRVSGVVGDDFIVE